MNYSVWFFLQNVQYVISYKRKTYINAFQTHFYIKIWTTLFASAKFSIYYIILMENYMNAIQQSWFDCLILSHSLFRRLTVQINGVSYFNKYKVFNSWPLHSYYRAAFHTLYYNVWAALLSSYFTLLYLIYFKKRAWSLFVAIQINMYKL